MKLLLTADIHGLDLAIKRLKTIGKCFDMVIVCGDVTPKYVDEGEDRASVQKEWFESVFLPLMDEINGYFILGNDDLIDYEGERLLRNGLQVINGLRIFAYDKVPRTPFNTYREVSDDDIWMELKSINDFLNLDIIVTHAPPYDILDTGLKKFGSRGIRGFVYWQKPKIHCFGHIHESFGIEKNNGITFVNAAFEISGKFVVAEFSKNKELIDVFTL